MIKDFLISFSDNFKEKTRNPFLGTYLIVWMIRNWELIFTIFNFDDDYNLEDKIKFVNSYYSEHSFLGNLSTTIFWAFGLLILTYLLLAITRFITNLFEKQLTPWIYKITDYKSIVLRETYENLKLENDRLELQLQKERDSKKRAMNEISELEKVIDNQNAIRTDENEKNKNDNTSITLDDEVSVLFNKIKNKKLVDEYIKVVDHIGEVEQGWISTEYWSDSVVYFVKLGLLSSGKIQQNYAELEITPVGEKVLRRSRLEVE